ncbi:hypothetical protein COR50_04035 [Chitinophaga caeni]|uniref:DUF4129 domain-containing protein n=1 Tax=Chitinophaga caeni TaxID=2029983 RepID=A0A291QR22_9BACT|nr:hypothetical protein [Chitinophaga caeni]ATL46410.1 hypothetical protein COR50_04035 [Chitinophaga caeni]
MKHPYLLIYMLTLLSLFCAGDIKAQRLNTLDSVSYDQDEEVFIDSVAVDKQGIQHYQDEAVEPDTTTLEGQVRLLWPGGLAYDQNNFGEFQDGQGRYFYNNVRIHTGSPAGLKELKEDSDMDYEKDLRALDPEHKKDAKHFPLTIPILMSFFIVASIVLIVVIVYNSRGTLRRIFKSSKNNTFSAAGVPDAESKVDYRSLADAAMKEAHWAEAVRYLYLYTLQVLASSQKLILHKDKTNRDYVNELSGTELQMPFLALTRQYEITWFGKKNVDEARFSDIRFSFQSFLKSINNTGHEI